MAKGGMLTPGRLAASAIAALSVLLMVPSQLMGQQVMTNTAASTYETFAGTDSVVSNQVQTTLVFPEVSLAKALNGPTLARVGQTFEYRLSYGNASATVPANAAVLIDTLPTGLEFVSAQPAPQVAGQVLTWDLGDLAPGATGEIVLTVVVSPTVRDTLRVINNSFLTTANAPMEEATAPEVTLVGEPSAQLAVDKTADLLEVGIGESAPFTIAVENTGVVPLTDIRIHDRLPAGGRYARGSAMGVDSVRANGQNVTFFVSGPLAPGATHTIHYAMAVVSAGQTNLQNVAYARAVDQAARSADVVAWVRVRTIWPMETRAAIGKVWVDLNDDGIQDPGEPGLERVDIWTDDGEVATTDPDGRFSYRNLRPGHHGFRLDPATLPQAYRMAGPELANDLEVRNADGWTTPRVDFRLISRGGSLAQVYLPVPWQLTARPRCPNRPDNTPDQDGECTPVPADTLPQQDAAIDPEVVTIPTPVVVELKGVTFAFGKADLTAQSSRLLDRVVASLVDHPEIRVEISGHTDSVGSAEFNLALSQSRAAAVRQYLVQAGIDPLRIEARGYGPDRPVADNATDEGRARNRRVELQVVEQGKAGDGADFRESLLGIGLKEGRRLAEYARVELPKPAPPPVIEHEVTVANPYADIIRGLMLGFELPVDSAAVYVDSVLRPPVTGPASIVGLPPIEPGAAVRVLGWTSVATDSVVVLLQGVDGPPDRVVAVVHNPLRPAAGTRLSVKADSLPKPSAVPAGRTVSVAVRPPERGWPGEGTFVVPGGWSYIEGSSRVGSVAVPDPELRRDRTGEPVLYWRIEGQAGSDIVFQLRPVDDTPPVDTVRVALLRDPVKRERDVTRSFIAGPGVQIFNPSDGQVFKTDRVFIGVRGEPSAPVALFVDDSLIGQPNLRVDGVYDFIAIPLPPGPHRLKVRMVNSWQRERWDSVAVHVSGLPAVFEADETPVRLIADGQESRSVRVRVRDRWQVPVINRPFVTVSAEGAEVLTADANASSVGIQIRPDEAGWLRIELRPGREVRRGTLRFSAGEEAGTIDLEILPAIRPLMVTGVGRVGVGASPDASASLTARGRLDDRTSLVVSYDSRDLDAGRDFFRRSADPLEEAQYPILGDASQRQIVAASRSKLSAKVERGYDWATVGDISTEAFASGLTLSRYRRALTGAGAQIATGPVTWQGFGSSTRQSLQQLQIRGAGISGPYTLQPDIKPGTEEIAIETRALDNPIRILTRQILVRYVDYQIDYEQGTILLKRPVPAVDVYQNPVFIQATYEAQSGGDRNWVWGMRASADALSLIDAPALDSLRIGASWIRDGNASGDRHLVGADARLIGFRGVSIGAEVSYSSSPDSTGVATALDATAQVLNGALDLSAGWLRIGEGFHNPSDIGLRAGTDEIRVGARSRIGRSELRLQHERQTFEAGGVRRSRTSGGVIQPLGPRVQIEAGVAAEQFESGTASDRSRAGELKATWTPMPRLRVWGESRYQFTQTGNAVRPDHVGAGAAFRFGKVSLEAVHRQVFLRGGRENYSATTLGLRTELMSGTEAWSSYQIAGADGAYNAALVGLSTRLKLGEAFSVDGMLERRSGLGRAPVADPARALPFLQPEEDYWSIGLGAEFLPQEKPYRLSARAEYRDGDFRSTRLVTLAGDVSVNTSLAILSRQEFLRSEQRTSVTVPQLSRRTSSLWGVAFRPTRSNALNLLGKFEYIDAENPIGTGVLTRQGDEGRLILAAEAIWSPTAATEFGLRYATRRTDATFEHTDGVSQALRSHADYIGWRSQVDLSSWYGVRGEGRLLLEHNSGTARYDIAPQLVVFPLDGFEIGAGYRFGDLQDPDFAVRGGHGAFVTVGVRVTENVFPTAAGFWRPRFGR